MSTAPTAKELVRTFVETLGGPNPQNILDLFAEDSWIHTTGTSVFSGKRRPAELVGLLGMLGSALPKGLRLEITRVIGEGDQAACEVYGYSVTKDGRNYNNHYVFWAEASNGKITLMSEFMDTLLVNTVLAQQN
jgi:ketosteroid isomerase-like protein